MLLCLGFSGSAFRSGTDCCVHVVLRAQEKQIPQRGVLWQEVKIWTTIRSFEVSALRWMNSRRRYAPRVTNNQHNEGMKGLRVATWQQCRAVFLLSHGASHGTPLALINMNPRRRHGISFGVLVHGFQKMAVPMDRWDFA